MLGLYIHIPFCDRKCLYCSFVIVVGQEQRMSAYIHSLAKEAKLYDRPKVYSVYLGGGTPSRLNHEAIVDLFNVLRKYFAIAENSELTVEVNPEDAIDVSKLELLKSLGVNRVSLGVQSFNDQCLKYLGRNHTSATAIKAYENIRAVGFTNVSCDLMFAFPQQTIHDLEADLNQISRMSLEHVSLYELTLEPNSRFYVKKIRLPQADDQAQQYFCIIDTLKRNGFEHYEVSNFAKPGFRSQHNLNYWQMGEYIGLGVAAHSHWRETRYSNVERFSDYLSLIEQNKSVIHQQEKLTASQRLVEAVLFGLRMCDGIDLNKMENRFSCRLDEERRLMLDRFVNEGFLCKNNEKLQVTRQGLLLLDDLSARLS